jgi:hypothetical protein
MSKRIVQYDEDLVNGGRSRDESVEQLLRRNGAGAPPVEACLDAEVIAAWLAGGLADHEREAAESHAANCARCQAMLAASVTAEPVAPTRRPWWSVGNVGWLVPATAAVATAFWFYLAPATGPATVRMTSVDRTAPVPVPDSPAVRAPEAPVRQLPEAKQRPDQAPVASRSANTTKKRAQDTPPLSNQDAARSARAEGAASAPAPAAPSPALLDAPAGLAESVGVRVEVVSPDPALRWRPAGSGKVERSTDGGRTWVRQDLPTALPITAGSSPSTDVCWLAGRSGVVALTTDGTTWTLRPLPESVDITGIHATSATSAEATTYDGRSFSTRDGGASWSHLPLQEFPAGPF